MTSAKRPPRDRSGDGGASMMSGATPMTSSVWAFSVDCCSVEIQIGLMPVLASRAARTGASLMTSGRVPATIAIFTSTPVGRRRRSPPWRSLSVMVRRNDAVLMD